MNRDTPKEGRKEREGGRFGRERPARRKPFVKPEIKREEPLRDVTLFTSTANVTGARFFP